LKEKAVLKPAEERCADASKESSYTCVLTSELQTRER
jgi:hypothetical protein